jgi:hypothetical protein
VQSIDLVADPATTSGLFEQAGDAGETAAVGWDALTLEQLELHRPDLVRELRRAHEFELEALRRRCDELAAREALAERRRQINELLAKHGLPLPTGTAKSQPRILSEQFLQSLLSAGDEATVERLVQERAELVRAARDWNGERRTAGSRPRSRDQAAIAGGGGRRCESAAQFAAMLRGR